MGTRLYRLMTGAVLVAAVLAFGAVNAHSDTDVGGIQAPWMDSLTAVGQDDVLKEHPLQYFLDSLGYDIDVGEDELEDAVFCGLDGLNTATMVIEVAGSAVYATSGYYEAGDTSTFYQLFGPSDGPGDSVQFTFASFDWVGFYMKPNLPGEQNTWLSEQSLNWDGFDHAWVFATGEPHEFLICWEDLPDGGDQDYQDLVVKIRFANQVPEVTLPDDFSLVLCAPEDVCFDIGATDANCEGDSIWLSMVEGEGSFATVAGLSTISAQHCFTPPGDGTYRFVFEVEDVVGAVAADTVDITVTSGSAPTVTLSDTSVFFCDPGEICFPVVITDPDCDVVSVSTNLGSYGGDQSSYDQVAMVNHLGGTVTQVGGGSPGTMLLTEDDYVPPVNSQSGVAVTLPDFVFPDQVVAYGTFPNSLGAGNSPDYIIGPPTDVTYTTPGAGGPDGGPGDGSIEFGQGDWCVLGFPETVTTCNGAAVDLIIFTNTAGGGPAVLKFRLDGVEVHSLSTDIAGGSSSSGMGGNTLDLPDGVTFNEVYIQNSYGRPPKFEIDAIAARTAVSDLSGEVCFWVDVAGLWEVIVTAEDSCGNIGTGSALVTVGLNEAPTADAGSDKSLFFCEYEEVCFDVAFTDPDDNIALTELVSGPGSLVGSQICYTPTVSGTSSFVIHVVDECDEEDYDTVLVTVTENAAPTADDPDDITQFLCAAEELCFDFTATDPDGGTLTWTQIAGPGTTTAGGHHCFTPSLSGTYTVTVAVADSCGLADTVSLAYDLTINTPPVATDPTSPVDVFQCTAAEICYQFAATDTEGGPLTWTKDEGDGTVTSAGLWCFTPTATGSYYVNVTVADSCGETD